MKRGTGTLVQMQLFIRGNRDVGSNATFYKNGSLTPFLTPFPFPFRNLHPCILIGTASDRYAGRIGQAYSDGRYEKGITRRSHKVRDKTFDEEMSFAQRLFCVRLCV